MHGLIASHLELARRKMGDALLKIVATVRVVGWLAALAFVLVAPLLVILSGGHHPLLGALMEFAWIPLAAVLGEVLWQLARFAAGE